MMTRTNFLRFKFATAMAAVLFWSQHHVDAQAIDTTYVLSPLAVAADTAFKLSVLSYDFDCTDSFSHQAMRQDGNTLHLSFMATSDSLKGCIAQYLRYGPSFDMPALPKGKYPVRVAQYPSCAYGSQPCPFALIEKDAGTLVVGDMGWFIERPTVSAGDSISLHLLNQAYGSCYNGFEHASFLVANGTISTSFVIAEYPARLCLVDLHPAGPAFQLPPLTVGRYPVSVQIMPACMFVDPPQGVCEIGPGPQVVDTLVVASGTPVRSVSRMRKGFALPSEFPAVRADGRKAIGRDPALLEKKRD